MKALLGAAALFAAALLGRPGGVNDAAITGEGWPAHLSDYGFFTDLKARAPAQRLMPYDLETPLFSDYAEKERYLYLPAGAQAKYDPEKPLDLPIGAALVKTFGYRVNGAFKPLETRVLLHRAGGWTPIPYVWNAGGTDADVKRAGTRIPVSFTDPSGEAHRISYAVPNQNQCKDCHGLAGQVTPIGVKVRYLNHGGQLEKMLAAGMLDRLPPDAPRVARWDDNSAPLDRRARAWLEINCAHCHNPQGAASNSGLFLDLARSDPEQRGLFKRPTAAGRGAGTRDFDIVPGDSEASILLYRMQSTDPGIAMPELGRATVHKEGVALVREWIEKMPKSAPAR
ncbi:SO2930 family diheme c-type cytochrome [Sphingomonas sp. HITSZ_GF]|uniref:SO2930 family diheme c-type cytochrome n=1 Tax=Sphingomonas sp. HITSZ_GF TaxID=3037247 RepID=UPI00240DA157|nr:SO2930 family diheme c-type cytochrome [Sphingomonas sp. HITSZ_GF]MDG2533503.1 SO2930 family diheme c-type cytochrome [Sphingomonas sp. HITSZ_GF]